MSVAPSLAMSTADAVRSVAEAVRLSDFALAARLADNALAAGYVHAALFNAKALWLERQNRNEEALAAFRQARPLAPKDPVLLNAIGACLTRLFQLDEAVATFDEAISLSPAYAATYVRKANALGLMGRTSEAERVYRRAAQLDPRNAEALASLATIAARLGRHAEAAGLAERALRIDRTNPTAHAALAMGELARNDFTAAATRLEAVRQQPDLLGHGRAVVMGLLGDALDGLARYDDAFSAYGAANSEQLTLHDPRFSGRAGIVEAVDELIDTYSRARPTHAPALSDATSTGAASRGHVFLLGFHRSGSTLLEQILECHPDVTTLEEHDCLAAAADRYLTTPEARARLEQLDEPALETARDEYWTQVRKRGLHPADKVFVDKHPFNLVKLPLIRKLFPNAKIVLALRDPRDVVLSCFRRQFEIDLVTFQFLTLEGAARLYDRVMELTALCRERFELRLHVHRYEDMIADFDKSLRAICDFIDISWHESMREFALAPRRPEIRSPSAEQVRRNLYAGAVGHWRNYEKHLCQALPMLDRWVAEYGYSTEAAK